MKFAMFKRSLSVGAFALLRTLKIVKLKASSKQDQNSRNAFHQFYSVAKFKQCSTLGNIVTVDSMNLFQCHCWCTKLILTVCKEKNG